MTADPNPRLPVSVLTGFLGSGKTTLLSRLIRDPAMVRTAVVINEFGEVGLDHLLVEKSSENTVLLNSGCVCCTVRGDLVTTLRDLFLKRVRGEIMEFDRVVVETSGLADPAPILHTLMTDPLIAARFRLDGVIATVDAVNGMSQLDGQPESVKQAAVADRIVLTKTDLATSDAVTALKARLKALNPAAPVLAAIQDTISPDRLFDAGLYDPKTKSLDVVRWLREEAYAEAARGERQADHHRHACGPSCNHRDHVHHHDAHHHDDDHAPNRHDDHIRSFCLVVDEPVRWDPFVSFMETLVTLHGTNLLRIKGLLNVAEAPCPVVIHGVQHLFHPPAQLDAWPSGDHRSRIVFITRDVSRETIEKTLQAYLESPAA